MQHLREISIMANETRNYVIAGVLSDVQAQLRALRALARYGEIGNGKLFGAQAEHLHVLVDGVAVNTHRMLDDCIEALGHPVLCGGNFDNAVQVEAEAQGRPIPRRVA
jgi:hypothetical protein